jgi:hypothetical protein
VFAPTFTKGTLVQLVGVVSRYAVLGCLLVLTACGGGSHDNAAVTTSSVAALSFSAATPDAATPGPQTFTASFSNGTVSLAINHDGAAVSDVHYTISGNTAQITVTPVAPATIGSGIFTSTIVITGYTCADANCTQLTPGNTETVTVTYTIPLSVHFVAPYVGTANKSESVVIRGQGFETFPVQDVQFGGTSASSYSVVSDTKITATYPALAAGNYAVTVVTPTTSAGPATSTASLVLQNAPGYTATTISYPSATSQLQRIIYDAERQTLLVARTTSASTTEIDTFPYTGSWNSGTSSAISGLADIALTANGQSLLSLSQTDVSLLDPITLSSSAATAVPVLPTGDFYKSLTVTNNNNALVTSGYPSSAATPMYLYSIANGSFTQPAGIPSSPVNTPSLNNSIPGISADGSLAVLAQGFSGAGASAIYTFSPATMTFAVVSNQTINQYAALPAVDRTGTTVVLNGTNVYRPDFILPTPPYIRIILDFTLLGTLPSTTEAVVISPDASKAYTVDSSTSPPSLLTYDLSYNAGGGAFPQIGTGATLAGDPGNGVQMTMSPDGGTLFIAGSNQIVVQPTP